MQIPPALFHNGERAQLKRSSTRQFVDAPTLLLLREIAYQPDALSPDRQSPAGVWGPRGRFRIYPALEADQWEWLEWNALAGPTPDWALEERVR